VTRACNRRSSSRAGSAREQHCVRFQVLTAASMKFTFVFWDVLPCKLIVDRRFRLLPLLMKAARTSETSVDNYFTRQYIPEDKSERTARLLVTVVLQPETRPSVYVPLTTAMCWTLCSLELTYAKPHATLQHMCDSCVFIYAYVRIPTSMNAFAYNMYTHVGFIIGILVFMFIG
jgi:hypothetical protein